MGRVNAQRLLLIYALINVALCAVVVLGFEGVSVVALVATVSMLYHARLRHFLLLPSCLALLDLPVLEWSATRPIT